MRANRFFLTLPLCSFRRIIAGSITFCLIASINLYAHEDVNDPGKPKNIYNQQKSKKQKDRREAAQAPFILKTNIFRVARGEFPILVEMPLGKKYSIDLGSSVTFTDYLLNAYWEMAQPFKNSSDTYSENPASEGNALINFGVSFNLKYFPNPDDILDGNAFGIYGSFRKHKYQVPGNKYGFNPAQANVSEVAIMYYYQAHSGFFSELATGIGLRQYVVDYINVDPTNISGNPAYTAGNGKLILPTIFLHWKLGANLFG